jgi:hypothetical protein
MNPRFFTADFWHPSGLEERANLKVCQKVAGGRSNAEASGIRQSNAAHPGGVADLCALPLACATAVSTSTASIPVLARITSSSITVKPSRLG